jgi:hypothetical protein
MKFYIGIKFYRIFFFTLLLAAIKPAAAQTDLDGLMMDKNFFCAGPTVGKNMWKNYWEGINKRNNLNLGKVTTSHAMIMGNYGITDKLNVLFGLPYIKTRASAGQLAGQQGLQDLSFFMKWQGWDKLIGKGELKMILIGGYAFPVSTYSPDLLPLSIGLHTRNSLVRLMADYQRGNWFATLSGSYVYRANVNLDRNSYYTTEMHYTNEVKMPDASQFNCRVGYRSSTWIAEAFIDQWTTLGGFDITKNNMPFVSNKMNATNIGIHVKYDTDFVNGLSFIADGNTTVAGRNAGQMSGYNAGVFYILDFSNKKMTDKMDNTHQTN